MNTSTILISILLILAIFVPFFILNSSGKGGLKAISKKIKEIAKEGHLKFDLKERWADSIIAIDRTKKILVFAKMVNDEAVVEKIDLEQVSKSAIQRKLLPEKSNTGNSNVLQRLDLEITFLGNEKKAKLLNFYDIDSSFTEDYEMQRAEKWNTVINEAVKSVSKEKKVA